QRCGRYSLLEKTSTNVPRYIASGSTQSNGTAATSVEMCVVTPSIRLEGTNDRMTHRSRVRTERRSRTTAAGAASGGRSVAKARTRKAQPGGKQIRTEEAEVHCP